MNCDQLKLTRCSPCIDRYYYKEFRYGDSCNITRFFTALSENAENILLSRMKYDDDYNYWFIATLKNYFPIQYIKWQKMMLLK